ncbi:hypothetical protein G9C85_00255 [Halorubellus sp. JP-L1]|uniref:hypothetical protein n=1 Tax=Halorubellus sp. JP-L1 TaxID=2715753 RepID=UPI00140C1583|nr:hypothetical protein [Halorubellus sp. JP-L1]NHN40070.1 hypothetical protein [Halorubellus sp. JP-L1]
MSADGHGTTQACPECDAAGAALYRRTSGSEANREDDPRKDWKCNDCGATFDEPTERERQQPANVRQNTLAGKLDAADPNDLVTDGGRDVVDPIPAPEVQSDGDPTDEDLGGESA